MATRSHIGIDATTFTAAVDFSACSSTQYRFVRAGSVNGEVALATGASNPTPFGVLQDSPSAGQGATVILIGTTKLAGRVSGCDLKFGRLVTSASDGIAESACVAGTSIVSAMWLGPNVTSGSVIGLALIYGGFATCSVAIS